MCNKMRNKILDAIANLLSLAKKNYFWQAMMKAKKNLCTSTSVVQCYKCLECKMEKNIVVESAHNQSCNNRDLTNLIYK